MVALTGEELQKWVEHISDSWKKLLTAHPEILSFACDIREAQSVAHVLQHIVAAELRFAERLNELEQTPYESISFDSVEAIYTTHDRAMELLRPLLERDAKWWEEVLVIQTRSAGTLRASRRTLLVHVLTHSIRHYAQLATLVRQHGVKHDLVADYLLMGLAQPVG